jgi:mono/diheme cytochrome c family protein
MLKPSLLLLAAVVLVVVSLPARGGSPQQGTPAPAVAPQPAEAPTSPVPARNPVKPTAESQARAKQLYAMDCSICHGDKGNGQTDVAKSMDMTLDDWTTPNALSGKPDAGLFAVIRNGKDKMPPEDPGRAKDNDVWNLIVYIRNFSKGAAAAPPTPPASPTNLTATPQ